MLKNYFQSHSYSEDDEDEVEGVMEAGVEHRKHREHDHVATRRHCAEHAHQQHRGHQSVWKKVLLRTTNTVKIWDIVNTHIFNSTTTLSTDSSNHYLEN